MGTTVMIAAGEFRALSARCQEQADMTAKLALRGAYRELAVEYLKLAVQQETIERLHALISRLDADDIAAGHLPSGSSTVAVNASIIGTPARSGIGRVVTTSPSSDPGL